MFYAYFSQNNEHLTELKHNLVQFKSSQQDIRLVKSDKAEMKPQSVLTNLRKMSSTSSILLLQ